MQSLLTRTTGKSRSKLLKNEAGGKAVKIIGGVFAFLVVAGVVAYFAAFKPASADAVCKNVIKITVDEARAQGLSAEQAKSLEGNEALNECKSSVKKGENDGILTYAQETKCAAKAKNTADLEKCEKK